MKIEVRSDEVRSPFRSSIVESGEGHEVRSKKSEVRSRKLEVLKLEVRIRRKLEVLN